MASYFVSVATTNQTESNFNEHHLPLVRQTDNPAQNSQHWLRHCCCSGYSNKQQCFLNVPQCLHIWLTCSCLQIKLGYE